MRDLYSGGIDQRAERAWSMPCSCWQCCLISVSSERTTCLCPMNSNQCVLGDEEVLLGLGPMVNLCFWKRRGSHLVVGAHRWGH
eukprot:10379405-Ditylum_brightwellii.AAC.1